MIFFITYPSSLEREKKLSQTSPGRNPFGADFLFMTDFSLFDENRSILSVLVR